LQINATIHDRFQLRTSVWIKKQPFCDTVHIVQGFGEITGSIFKAVLEESYCNTLNIEAKSFLKTTAI